MKPATFFFLETTRIFTKLLPVSKSSVKLKVRPNWTLFVILLTSAVILLTSPVVQGLLHGNKNVQFL